MSTPYPTTIGLAPSFGFGDRIGLATPGHVAAMRQAGEGVTAMFAQQSIREMTRTGRSPDRVMGDAMSALLGANWQRPHAADADHLKTLADIDMTADVGFTFFTLDPSGDVDQRADDYSASDVDEKFATLRESARWVPDYVGRDVTLPNGTRLEFDEASVKRAAVKYGAAIDTAVALGAHVAKVQEAAGRPYEIELSVDETDQPTTLVEHYIIAELCLSQGMKLVSLAPRFVGKLEKGVDYIGDVSALEASLADHAAIAKSLGPYKLSLHSGSDKLSMYPALARATEGRFHVKTAGTSYLEAVRVAALEEPELFRDLIRFARERYDTDRATYHVHATLASAPEPSSDVSDQQLQDAYLENWETVPGGAGFTAAGRQILHCTFGSTLTDELLGPALRECLESNLGSYTAVLCEHFSRHLEALR
ncbi:tagaturonate epimerase family protein [Botrimarina hoheduenensis]|uniref:Tagaturonate/fructuronate epimerase n=1 Tax=Botrimarina hoheduenensis TaxID=2528000 RepID=A0A5C5VST6_9BACT|nr:tagaturonate epimerase family protein [Botrimarina hoheduenensis]TWT40649.1 hypothetical protein Pla111_32940 [Botrimarina hoheduenensis]